ncbi:hypothetical protein CC80DRAFT_530505 [Byssothecium circinans]|uniref:Uncharacterized protein n=1 Tax=Byssothecium circinans TaxID=147558 RepID=A0A6A5UIV4_9PLEO|nr:hypothetical protein CC80DRAFT_530505 [Byssothecium circinans]
MASDDMDIDGFDTDTNTSSAQPTINGSNRPIKPMRAVRQPVLEVYYPESESGSAISHGSHSSTGQATTPLSSESGAALDVEKMEGVVRFEDQNWMLSDDELLELDKTTWGLTDDDLWSFSDQNGLQWVGANREHEEKDLVIMQARLRSFVIPLKRASVILRLQCHSGAPFDTDMFTTYARFAAPLLPEILDLLKHVEENLRIFFAMPHVSPNEEGWDDWVNACEFFNTHILTPEFMRDMLVRWYGRELVLEVEQRFDMIAAWWEIGWEVEEESDEEKFDPQPRKKLRVVCE